MRGERLEGGRSWRGAFAAVESFDGDEPFRDGVVTLRVGCWLLCSIFEVALNFPDHGLDLMVEIAIELVSWSLQELPVDAVDPVDEGCFRVITSL